MGAAKSLSSMLTCSHENECAIVTWSGSKVALTNTQGPPRPDADNHWHPETQRSQMTREESNNWKVMFSDW